MNTRDMGFAKEKDVALFLKSKGYKILETNYRTSFGEIDIIAKNKGDIVFIEVKYRKSSYSGTPQEAVNYRKQQKIIKSALAYIKQNSLKNNIRFDVAAVSQNHIEIIESAFCAQEGKYYF
ncbi:MAG: YraN family protein [Endomicrobium sp.]|jgi:putative endonuclease|nr:YraN family protein [Endomicrobium sp.]